MGFLIENGKILNGAVSSDIEDEVEQLKKNNHLINLIQEDLDHTNNIYNNHQESIL